MATTKLTMVYQGTTPLDVTLPGKGVVQVVKGDKVDFAEYGGKAFFEGRGDFKPYTTNKRATKPKPASKGG